MSSTKGKELEKRASNYSESEKSLLLDCVTQHINVIENKKTDGTTAHAKDAAWEEISREYNSRTTTLSRATASLRKCYENLKKIARKRAGDERMDIFKTGGGLPKIIKSDYINERVRAIIEPAIVPLSYDVDVDPVYIASTDRIKPKPLETITSSSSKATAIVLASAAGQGFVTIEDYHKDEPLRCVATRLEDDNEFEELFDQNTIEKPSDWTQGSSTRLREPIHDSPVTNANSTCRNRRGTPALRPVAHATAETTQKFGMLAESKLELTKLHTSQLKGQIERQHIHGDLQKKILEVELTTKQAILDQELIKLANLHKESSDLQKKILEVELATKQAILDQELIKLANLRKEMPM